MSRLIWNFALAIGLALVGLMPSTTYAQSIYSECPEPEFPQETCRIFEPTSGDYQNKVRAIRVQTLHAYENDLATRVSGSIIQHHWDMGGTGSMYSNPNVGQDFYIGEPITYPSGDHLTMLVFVEGDVVSRWIIITDGTDFVDEAISAHVAASKTGRDDAVRSLPDTDHFPDGFSILEENFHGLRRPNNTTNSDLQQSEAPSKISDNKVTRTPRTGSSSTSDSTKTDNTRASATTSSSSSTSGTRPVGPVKILDVSSKDAGTRDGSRYVYVEVQNTSGRQLKYVQIDLVCRDSNDRVVATGIANIMGLSPGDTAVLTGVILRPNNCVKIGAQVNPLTD